MDTTWKVTEADRDDKGFVKTNDAPRSLADLLPQSEEIRQDAKRQPLTRTELATLAGVVLIAAFVLIYAWTMPSTPTAAPTPRQTAAPTFQPTPAPTVAPAPTPLALVAYFDYADPETATAIDARQIERVVGQAGAWRLVQAGTARVWVPADAVPAGVPADSPLPNLAPPTPRPVPAVQPVAPPVVPPAPCTRDIAPYVVSRRVMLGTLPIGEAVGFSCTSAAEAEANAAAHEAEVRASYAKTSEAGR